MGAKNDPSNFEFYERNNNLSRIQEMAKKHKERKEN